MKNSEIHKDFSDKDTRDLLAKVLADLGKKCYYRTDYGVIEGEIARLEQQATNSRAFVALKSLIKHLNWEEIDASDNVEDYNRDTYFPFIGTAEEYELLIGQKLVRV